MFRINAASAWYSVVGEGGSALPQMTVSENVSLFDDGSAQFTILMSLPESPLAETYKKTLASPDQTDDDEIVPIPESVPFENGSIGVIPIREDFYKSIVQQQMDSLGLYVNISSSALVPRSSDGEFKIWLGGQALPSISNVTKGDPFDNLDIIVGPRDAKTYAGEVFTDIQLVQMMLKSFSGSSVYCCRWNTQIELPANAFLLNGDDLSQLQWTIDFGSGTQMTASVSVYVPSTVVLEEITTITVEDITTSAESLEDGFRGYKNFNIQFDAPSSSVSYLSGNSSFCTDDWSFDQPYSWNKNLPLFEGDYDGSLVHLHASLEASIGFDLTWHIGWDFDWLSGLKSFETWVTFTPYLDLQLNASASASYSKTWKHTFISIGKDFYFTVPVGPFPVPVWVRLNFEPTGYITFNAFGEIDLYAEAEFSKTFTAGVTWSRNLHWQPYYQESGLQTNLTGPTIVAEAGVSLRGGLDCNLSFLFYDVAGPFIEFEPYALTSASCILIPPDIFQGQWEVSANVRIAAGVTFSGWLRWLIGLNDWEVTLLDKILYIWNGTWPQGSEIEVGSLPDAPGRPEPDNLLSTTGSVTWIWAPPSENNETIIQYHLQLGTAPGKNDTLDEYTGIDLNRTVFDLRGNFTYYARVQAKNNAGWGNYSEVSEGVKVDMPPTCVITNGPIGIVDPENAYRLNFNWTATDDVTSSSDLMHSYFLEGLDPGWSEWTSATGAEYTNLTMGNYTFWVRSRDQIGNIQLLPADRSFAIYKIASLFPAVLNLGHLGDYVLARIELPLDYELADINVSSIRLNNTLAVGSSAPEPVIEDYDNDTVPDLTICFDRAAFSEYIESQGIKFGNVTLEISGILNETMHEGIPFEGISVIRVRMAGDVNIDGKVNVGDVSLVAQAFGSNPSYLRWNSAADENEDGKVTIVDVALVAQLFGHSYVN